MWLLVYGALDPMKTCGYVFMAAGLNEDMWDACRVCPPLKGTVPWESPEPRGLEARGGLSHRHPSISLLTPLGPR